MKDRQSKRPGRVKIAPENGQPAFYATIEMADEPLEDGTPLNAATMLSDSVAAKLGVQLNATPSNAFSKLKDDIGDAVAGAIPNSKAGTIITLDRKDTSTSSVYLKTGVR